MAEARKLDFVKTAPSPRDMMGPDDLLSIVTYSQRVEIPGRPVPWAGPGDAPPDHLRAVSGRFDLPLRRAGRGVPAGRGRKRRGTMNRVLLLSDGLANVGVTNRGALRERAGDMPNAGSPSPRSESEFFRRELMTMIAGGGGGKYRYLEIPSGSWRRWNPSSTPPRGRPRPRSRSSSA